MKLIKLCGLLLGIFVVKCLCLYERKHLGKIEWIRTGD